MLASSSWWRAELSLSESNNPNNLPPSPHPMIIQLISPPDKVFAVGAVITIYLSSSFHYSCAAKKPKEKCYVMIYGGYMTCSIHGGVGWVGGGGWGLLDVMMPSEMDYEFCSRMTFQRRPTLSTDRRQPLLHASALNVLPLDFLQTTRVNEKRIWAIILMTHPHLEILKICLAVSPVKSLPVTSDNI